MLNPGKKYQLACLFVKYVFCSILWKSCGACLNILNEIFSLFVLGVCILCVVLNPFRCPSDVQCTSHFVFDLP
jgi:hypothetical protein